MYEAEISRWNPTSFIFLLDQSASMNEEVPVGISKAEVATNFLNECLKEMIVIGSKPNGVSDYVDVAVLGYGESGVINCLKTERIISPLSEIQQSVIRVENRKKRVSDDDGSVIEVEVRFPIWVEAKAKGDNATKLESMKDALMETATQLAYWCENHPNSYPPILMHITDGIYGGDLGEISEIVEIIKEFSTNDGNVLMFNLQISADSADPIVFPDSLPNSYSCSQRSQPLFAMSSELPIGAMEYLHDYFVEHHLNLKSRGFLFNSTWDAICLFRAIVCPWVHSLAAPRIHEQPIEEFEEEEKREEDLKKEEKKRKVQMWLGRIKNSPSYRGSKSN